MKISTMLTRLAALAAVSLIATSAYADWQYKEVNDKMRGTKTQQATTASLAKVVMQVPLDGGVDMLISVNKIGNKLTGVYFSTSEGSLYCNTNDIGCEFSAKFDDGPVETFKGVRNMDAGPVKIYESEKFYKKLAKSKTLIIEASMFMSKTQQIEFDVAGLK